MRSVETKSPNFQAFPRISITRPLREESTRISNLPLDSRGRGGRRRGEIEERVRIPHAPLEVAVLRRQADLTVREEPELHPWAGPAGGMADDGTGLLKDLDVSLPQGLVVDPPRAGIDQQAGSLCDPASLQDLGGGLEVFEASVGAGPQEDLVHPDPFFLDLRGLLDIAGGVRDGDEWFERRALDFNQPLVRGAGVRRERSPVLLPAVPLHPSPRLFVRWKEAQLGPALLGHAGDGEPGIHREVADRLSVVLHRLVDRAVLANGADDVEDDVLG